MLFTLELNALCGYEKMMNDAVSFSLPDMFCLSSLQDGLRRLSGNEYILSTKRKFT